MVKGNALIIGLSDYTDNDKPFGQVAKEIASLTSQAQGLGCNILLLGCLSVRVEIAQLGEHLQALAEQFRIYIVWGLKNSLSGEEERCFVAVPSEFRKSFCGSRALSKSLEADPFTTWFDSPWGRIAVMTGESIVLQPEIQRYYAASGVSLVLNPCRMRRRTTKKSGLSFEHHKRSLAAIADRDQIYIAAVNAAPQSISLTRATAVDAAVIAPIPFKGSCVSELVQHPGSDRVALAKVSLESSSDCFTQDFFRPELYSKWYKQIHSLPARPTGQSIKLAVSNFVTDWGNKQANLQNIIQQSIEAAQGGCNLILFPEMALTGYSFVETLEPKCMQHRLAETIPGPSTKILSKISKEHQIYIILGMPEKDTCRPDVYYNAAAIVSPEGQIQSYRKVHPVGDETRWCVSGDQPFILDTPWGRLGISICFDTYFGVEMIRYYAGAGVQLLLNPTASIKGVPQGRWLWYYTSRLESIAYRDKMLIASANLLGKDGLAIHKGFQGGSSIHGHLDGRHKNYAGAFTNKSPGIICSQAVDLSVFGDGASLPSPERCSALYQQLCEDDTL